MALRSPAVALFGTLPETTVQAPSPLRLDAVGRILENNLKVTVYITTGALDQRRVSSFSQLRQLAILVDDTSLGDYSVTRPHLDALPVATIAEEVVESERYVEALIGRTTDTFGDSHGAYDRRVRAAVIDAGVAVAVKDVISQDRADLWAIARYTVTGDTDTKRLELVVHGWGAPLARGRERFRTRLARTARRAGEQFREAA